METVCAAVVLEPLFAIGSRYCKYKATMVNIRNYRFYTIFILYKMGEILANLTRWRLCRWLNKFSSGTNETAFSLVFFLFWSLTIGWLRGEIWAPIYIGCFFLVISKQLIGRFKSRKENLRKRPFHSFPRKFWFTSDKCA